MPVLSLDRMTDLLVPFYPTPSPELVAQLSAYLDLLVKWNARTNLTAIREPEEMVRRHFGESLFTARHLPPCETLLDLGSGAGFPGLPIQLALPQLRVTLAESQNKKASFLREAVRVLGLKTEVWAARVEEMPDRTFDVVALRAVDHPVAALALARRRLVPGGTIAHLTALDPEWTDVFPVSRERVDGPAPDSLKCSTWNNHVRSGNVPRGTIWSRARMFHVEHRVTFHELFHVEHSSIPTHPNRIRPDWNASSRPTSGYPPMTRRVLPGLLLLLVFFPSFAFAAPRDAQAVLNRCGKPLKGETTILENTVAGGRRILNYERGALTFDKVANIGWTFSYGTHKKDDHLTAEQMEKYMPCLKDALADSAAPEPLVTVTPVQRVEVSVKRGYKALILYTLLGLVILGLCILVYSRSRPKEMEDDQPL